MDDVVLDAQGSADQVSHEAGLDGHRVLERVFHRSQGRDGVREGQKRVDLLEEAGAHLDGEDAARSAKLHHKRDDRDSFTHVSKTGRERIDDVRENDRAEYACQQIEPEVFALNTHEEDVPNAEYDPL